MTFDVAATAAVAFTIGNVVPNLDLTNNSVKMGTIIMNTTTSGAIDVLTVTLGSVASFCTLEALINLSTTDTSVTSTGTIHYIQRFKATSAGVHSVATNPTTLLQDLDVGLAGAAVGMVVSGPTSVAKLQVTGATSGTVRWHIDYKLMYCKPVTNP